ncbi:MAG: signal peptidase II [bacterium]|nr:signal peptidase II [bacterium]
MGRHAAELTAEGAELERRASTSRRDRGLIALLFGLAVVVVLIDQITKQWALGNLSETTARPFIGDLISFQLTFNPGAAFGIASGTTWIFTLIAVVVAVVVIRLSRHIGSLAWTICLGLLLGGAIGNLIDRLFRDPGFPEGHVVDFINYAGRFIGNVADIAIVGAAIGIALLALLGVDVDGSRTERGSEEPEAADRELETDVPAETDETDETAAGAPEPGSVVAEDERG